MALVALVAVVPVAPLVQQLVQLVPLALLVLLGLLVLRIAENHRGRPNQVFGRTLSQPLRSEETHEGSWPWHQCTNFKEKLYISQVKSEATY